MTDEGRGGGAAIAAGVLAGLMGLGLTVMVSVTEAPVRSRATEIVAMAIIVLAPLLIGMGGRWRHPGVLLAAGVVSLPLTMISFAGVGLPYAIVAILFFVAAGRRGRVRVWQLPIGLAMAALVVASFFALFSSSDQVCWTKERLPDGGVRTTYEREPYSGTGSVTLSGDELSGGCTETPSYQATLLSLTLSVAAIVGGTAAIESLDRRWPAIANA